MGGGGKKKEKNHCFSTEAVKKKKIHRSVPANTNPIQQTFILHNRTLLSK